MTSRIRSAYEWVTGDLDGGQCRVTPLPAFVAPTGYTDAVIAALWPVGGRTPKPTPSSTP